MKRVPVYGRTGVVAYALVDDADGLLVAQFQWHRAWSSRRTTMYAQAHISRPSGRSTVRMHRLILGLGPDDPDVDHENGNGLDNRRSNLRPATHAENGANSRSRSGSSRYKGVSPHRQSGKWRAVIQPGGQVVSLGLFDTEEAAARAYDEAAREKWGEFARTNFPTKIPAVPSNRRRKV